MRYENMPCPVCGSHMHEGDDIVVCPDCGTPCHRECWKETGHCINESKHAAGFVFNTAPVNSLPSDNAEDGLSQETPDDMIYCHICGSANPVTSRNCNHCGALLIHDNDDKTICPICKANIAPGMPVCPNCGASLMPKGTVPLRQYAPFFGNDPDEKIGENTAGEIGTYVRTNQVKYLHKFHNIEDGGKINFNWAAFFFGPFWFLFRKMFLYGTVLLVLISCVSLITAPSSEKAYEIFSEYSPQITEYNKIISGTTETTSAGSQTTQSYATGRADIDYDTKLTTAAAGSSAEETAEEAESEESTTSASETTTAPDTTDALTADEATQKSLELQTEMYKKMLEVMWKPLLIVLAIYLVINIFCGFYADGLYYKKIKHDLEAVKEEVPDSNVRTMLISRRGGISILNVICGVFAYDLFQSLASSLADFVSKLF